MICCACPYNQRSNMLQGSNGGLAQEILAPGCFAASLARRSSVRLHRGHRGPVIGKVRPFETEKGLFFEYGGELPADWTGFSVRLKAIRWKRIGPEVFLLQEAELKHIALLRGDETPAYPQTKTGGINPPAIDR